MKKITLLTLILSMVLYSCNWDDFGDLNVNPNASTTPKTSALLTNAMLSSGGMVTATTGALYTQMLANKQYTSEDNYLTINFSQDGWYNGPLADLDKIIRLNSDDATKDIVAIDGSNANQIAIAKIMQSYYFLWMTNRWGDLPYSEALQGQDGLLKPVFDSQEAIYDGCLQSLKDAVAMMDAGAAIKGDVLLNGDMARWRKFANSIRLVAALRLSKINPAKSKTEFESAFTAGVIETNAENVKYSYQTVQTYENPYYNSFVTSGRKDWTIADPLMNFLQINTYTSPHSGAVGKMNVVADPRLPVYAAPIENTTSTYIGMPYGLSEATAGGVPNSQVSFIGLAFRQQNTPGWLMTAAHIKFCLAEGAFRGYTVAKTAQVYYEEGIQASMAFHGVSIGNYLTNSEVAFTAGRELEQILTQKWIALFPDGYEAWAEWRRTGFPVLSPAANATNESGEIPRRQGYSTSEATLNVDNYNAALSRQGFTKDDLDGRVWWDKQ